MMQTIKLAVGKQDTSKDIKVEHNKLHWLLTFTFLLFLLGNTPFKKPFYAVLVLAYLTLMYSYLKAGFRILLYSYSIAILWLLLIASYFWSVVPSATLEVIRSQSTFLLFILCISATHQSTGISAPFRTAAIALVSLAAVYSVAFPGASLLTSGLKAFYIHKNLFGAMMGICALVLFHAPQSKKIHVVLGLVATGLLIASQSKTSISLFVLCNVMLFLANFLVKNLYSNSPRHSMKDIFKTILLVSAILMLVFMVIFRDELIKILWANLTKEALTGRGQLWLVVIQQIRAHALLGIGPGVFWQAGAASEIAQTTLFIKDPYWVQRMISSDGGYIDLVASLGVLGLAFFLLTAVDLYRRLFRNWHQSDTRMIFVLVTFVLLHAITESTILYSTNILWMTYLLCYFRVVGFDMDLANKVKKRKLI